MNRKRAVLAIAFILTGRLCLAQIMNRPPTGSPRHSISRVSSIPRWTPRAESEPAL